MVDPFGKDLRLLSVLLDLGGVFQRLDLDHLLILNGLVLEQVLPALHHLALHLQKVPSTVILVHYSRQPAFPWGVQQSLKQKVVYGGQEVGRGTRAINLATLL